MSKLSNDNSKIVDFIEDLLFMQQLYGLDKINPIFGNYPKLKQYKDGSDMYFEMSSNGILLNKKKLQKHYDWYSINNITFRYDHSVSAWGKESIPSTIKVCLDFDTIPIYIYLILKTVRNHYKNCLVTIKDWLPTYINFSIQPVFKYKKDNLLRKIAADLRVEKEITNRLLKTRSHLGLKETLVDLIKVSGREFKFNGTYCLCCGSEVKSKTALFCNSTKTSLKTKYPSNCRNKFRLRIIRSGIKKENALKFAKNLHNELLNIIEVNPITAFEQLAEKYPKIYIDKRKRK